jgi:hypothetical protein
MPNWPSLYKKTTDRRKEWVALKKAHAANLKASKVDFDAKLGAAIDKFEVQVKKMATEDYGKKSTAKSWAAVATAASQLASVVHTYQGKLAALPGATKTQLGAFLKALAADADLWSTAAQAPGPKQGGQLVGDDWVEVYNAVQHLEALLKRSQILGETIAEARAAGQTTDPTQLAFMAERETLAGAIHDNVPAALDAAKKVEALRVNFGKDAAYKGLLKETGLSAVAGPWAPLRQQLAQYANLHKTVTRQAAYSAESAAVAVLAGNIERELAAVEGVLNAL